MTLPSPSTLLGQTKISSCRQERPYHPATQEKRCARRYQALRPAPSAQPLRSGPRYPEIRLRNLGKGVDQDIESLVPVQPAKSQQQRGILWRSKDATVQHASRPGSNEIWQVMGPSNRPALPGYIVDQARRIADPDDRNHDNILCRNSLQSGLPGYNRPAGFGCGPAHPGRTTSGAKERISFLSCRGVSKSNAPPKPSSVKSTPAARKIAARRASLRIATRCPTAAPRSGFAMSNHPFEKYFGAAVACACHGLIKPNHSHIGKACDSEHYCGVAVTGPQAQQHSGAVIRGSRNRRSQPAPLAERSLSSPCPALATQSGYCLI